MTIKTQSLRHHFIRIRRFLWRRLGWGTPLEFFVIKGSLQDETIKSVFLSIKSSYAENSTFERVYPITRYMYALADAMKDTPTDPSPLSSTLYRTEGQAVLGCATPEIGAALLYAVVRATKPERVVEIGAAHGFGACYIAAALRDNGSGKVSTLEGMYTRVKISRETACNLGFGDLIEVVPGNFKETVPIALQNGANLIFSDGDKSVELTRSQFNASIESMWSGGWLFFDDINHTAEIAELFNSFVDHDRIVFACSFFNRWALLKVMSHTSGLTLQKRGT